jgi:preprotein translocase subunit SecD
MNSNLRWKLILIVAVIGLSVWSFYPPWSKVNLGLDLKGGVHMVLKVRTDDGLRAETESVVERLRDTLTRAGVQFSKLEMKDPRSFVVEGIQNDQAFRAAATDPETVFNRTSGAGSYTYTLKPNIENQLRDETVTQALQTIERRVNELGVAEPIVARQGAVDQILVELPRG